MKQIITTVLILVTLNAFSQTSVKAYKVYKVIDHKNFFGERTTFDTIKVNTIIDVYFFSKHFYYPSLPTSLKNTQYKNQTVVVWAKIDTVKNSMKSANWTNTYNYDSLSRVTSFAYSGCFVCNSMPSKHTITYNKQGWVASVTKNTLGHDSCKLEYDVDGNITKLEYYTDLGLTKSIIMQ